MSRYTDLRWWLTQLLECKRLKTYRVAVFADLDISRVVHLEDNVTLVVHVRKAFARGHLRRDPIDIPFGRQ